MDIDAKFLNSEPVNQLCAMFAASYTPPKSFFGKQKPPDPIAMLNAVGACAGFAAQAAVWRALIMPKKRNPGDFLFYVTTHAGDVYLFGDSINLFLYSTTAEHLSFLSVAAAVLPKDAKSPDIHDLARHVTRSIGNAEFGIPRLPHGITLPDSPREALDKTWRNVSEILKAQDPARWPVVLGGAAWRIASANKDTVPPELAVTILLEAAVPVSKTDPRTVQPGIQNLSLTVWCPRAIQSAGKPELIDEIRAAMPAAAPRRAVARPLVIAAPRIGFLNLLGARGDYMVTNDSSYFGGLFNGAMTISTSAIPRCDVLFVYCTFAASGMVKGQKMTLREIIAKSGALIAVSAAEVPDEIMKAPDFMKALGHGRHAPVNLILVNNRNGAAFGRFIKAMFEMMWNGIPMPVAYVKLAPQVPAKLVSPAHKDIPGTLCIIGAGHVVFGQAA